MKKPNKQHHQKQIRNNTHPDTAQGPRQAKTLRKQDIPNIKMQQNTI